jgi:monoterpene epsilon-lactone hydrolase
MFDLTCEARDGGGLRTWATKGGFPMASAESAQLRRVIVNNVAPLFSPDVPLENVRAFFQAMGEMAVLPPDITTEPVDAGGVPGEWVFGPGAAEDRALLYLHGGGYVVGSAAGYRNLAARLSLAAGVRVLSLDYRLAPEHPFPAALDDTYVGYCWLRASGYLPEHIAIGGDSAGGGLSLAVLLAMRDVDEELPAAGVLLSPWTDLTGSGESITSRAEMDPLFQNNAWGDYCARCYLGDANPAAPMASPVFADLQGLPPLLIQVGDHEILLSDATRVAEEAQAVGVEATLKVWDEMWHVWHLFAPDLPEANEAIVEAGTFLSEKLA